MCTGDLDVGSVATFVSAVVDDCAGGRTILRPDVSTVAVTAVAVTAVVGSTEVGDRYLNRCLDRCLNGYVGTQCDRACRPAVQANRRAAKTCTESHGKGGCRAGAGCGAQRCAIARCSRSIEGRLVVY